MNTLLNLSPDRRDCGFSTGDLRLLLVDVQVSRDAALEFRASQLEEFLLAGDVAAHDRKLLLESADDHVIPRQFGQERDHRAAAGVNLGIERVLCRLDCPASAAEEIDLPPRIEARLVKVGSRAGKAERGTGGAVGGTWICAADGPQPVLAE